MKRKYWKLPFWVPIGLRNLVLAFEPHSQAEFVKHCTDVGMKRFGVFYLPGDWRLIAAYVHLAAGKIGVSPYWLAAMWADPQADADWDDEGAWHK